MSTPSLSLSNSTISGSNVTAIFAETSVTPTLQHQYTTVANLPPNNPGWSRGVQISPQYVFIKRGQSSFAFAVGDLVSLAIFQQPSLSWSPLIGNGGQPVNESVVHNSGGANSVNISVSNIQTETNVSFSWFYSNAGIMTAIANAANINNCTYTITSNTNSSVLNAAPKTTGQNNVVHLCVLTNLSGNTNANSVTLTIT